MYACANSSGVIYIYLILFCYWNYKLSASVSTSRSLNKLTHVSSICHWDMKLESAEIDICLIVIWASNYLISKRFSLLKMKHLIWTISAPRVLWDICNWFTSKFEWISRFCHSSSLPYVYIFCFKYDYIECFMKIIKNSISRIFHWNMLCTISALYSKSFPYRYEKKD